MKRLKEYIVEFSPYPDQIILKKFHRGIFYQGKVKNIPEYLKEYFVLEHTKLTRFSYVIFTLVEDIG